MSAVIGVWLVIAGLSKTENT